MGFPPADSCSRRILAAQVTRLSGNTLFQQLQELISVEAMRTSLAAAAHRFDLAEEYVLEVVKEYLYRKPPTAFPYDRFEASTQTPDCFVITDTEDEAQAAPLPGESDVLKTSTDSGLSAGKSETRRNCGRGNYAVRTSSLRTGRSLSGELTSTGDSLHKSLCTD